jgi:serine/threonine protein kinase
LLKREELMSDILKPNQRVRAETSGMMCEVKQFLGGGGQGEVYSADLGGMLVALKWYFSTSATPHQRAILETLTKKGPPNEKFLWPIELASSLSVLGFGYVMPLREPRYKSIVDLVKNRVAPSFRSLATAGLELSHSYLQLHSKGLCYRDISFGNVFFAPATGEVLICDNDNVTVDGDEKVSVLGTPRFMAPELVRRETVPSTKTDLFSLAVLLFYMFMIHHPLEGKKESSIRCLDQAAMTKLYGSEPTFIFDPDDRSNEPLPGYHDNALTYWPIYPLFLRNLFIKAFTDGIKDPANGRVRESEWRGAMVRLRDSILYCSSCGSENFYDGDALRISDGGSLHCWSCKAELRLPFRLRIGRNTIIMLNHDTKLYPHHLDDQKMYDFSQPVAEVTQHPTNPNIWGLKNVSGKRWVVAKADGTIQEVEVGRSVTLAKETKIQFGNTEGEIRY